MTGCLFLHKTCGTHIPSLKGLFFQLSMTHETFALPWEHTSSIRYLLHISKIILCVIKLPHHGPAPAISKYDQYAVFLKEEVGAYWAQSSQGLTAGGNFDAKNRDFRWTLNNLMLLLSVI